MKAATIHEEGNGLRGRIMKKVTDATLERLANMREVAQLILDECSNGETVETESDGRTAVEEAVDLAKRLIIVATEPPGGCRLRDIGEDEA